jgi:DivIVA domain-containing protein
VATLSQLATRRMLGRGRTPTTRSHGRATPRSSGPQRGIICTVDNDAGSHFAAASEHTARRPWWLRLDGVPERWRPGRERFEQSPKWRVGSDIDWANSYLSPLSAEAIRRAGFRECVSRGYARDEVDDLLERVAIRMEAHQDLDDLLRSVNFRTTLRGYEPDDVERLFVRLGGTVQEVDHKQRLPLGRRELVRILLWIAAGMFLVALVAVGIAYLTSTGTRSQILAILGLCGIGVGGLALSANDFTKDKAFGGSDLRSFLLSCVLVIGGFGGALNGVGADSGWGRLSGVALGLAGLPAFTIYVRKMWIYFRHPAGGKHQS